MTATTAIRTVGGAADATAAAGTNGAFYERLWRTAGIQAAAFFVLGYIIHGSVPGVGASGDSLVSFYDGDRTRVLVAAVVTGFAVLNLMWFAAAIRTTLTNAGQEGWGAAATAASASFGGIFLLVTTLGAALALSITDAGNDQLTSGLNDVAWAGFVLSSFPRAMLIMAGSFGLWRAGMVTSAWFAAGVAAIVAVLAGATTWATDGFWAPDGAYSLVVSPVIAIVWIAAATRALTPSAEATTGW